MMRMGKETTKDPKRAVQIAFDTELPWVKPHVQNERHDRFNEVASSFRRERLLRGPETAIHELVHKNLDRLSNLKEFRAFRVDCSDDSVVQILAFFPSYAIAVQIWKAGFDFFFTGSDEFMASASARDPRVRMETTEKIEAE